MIRWSPGGRRARGIGSVRLREPLIAPELSGRPPPTPRLSAPQKARPVWQAFSTTDPFRPATVRRIYGKDDSVIVLWDGCGTTIDDSTLPNTYTWFIQMRKLIDVTAFYDTISFKEFGDSVMPAIGRRRHAVRHPTVLLPRSVSNARTRQLDMSGREWRRNVRPVKG